MSYKTWTGMAWSLPKHQHGGHLKTSMKKLTATILCLIVLSISAVPLVAQTRTRACNSRTNNSARYNNRYDGRYNRNARYDGRYDTNVYRNDPVYTNDAVYNNDDVYYGDDASIYTDNRSVWEKHRDKITTVAGAVGGAAIGGIVGGKKGAIIGAIAGGASTAIYTYKIRDKYPRY